MYIYRKDLKKFVVLVVLFITLIIIGGVGIVYADHTIPRAECQVIHHGGGGPFFGFTTIDIPDECLQHTTKENPDGTVRMMTTEEYEQEVFKAYQEFNNEAKKDK